MWKLNFGKQAPASLDIVIQNSQKANALFYENKQEASLYLGKILELTFTNPEFLRKISAKVAGEVGVAYLNLLDLVSEQKFFQTLSTLAYYFISKGIDFKQDDYALLGKRIITLNLGAQTFCRTLSKAKGLSLPQYINFADWKRLPMGVKFVLMLEFKDLGKLQTMVLLPHDMQMRKQWLDSSVREGFFDDICSITQISNFASELHDKTMQYLDNEILQKGTFYFHD